MQATKIHPKVAAAGLATPAAVVLIWLAGVLGVDMTPEVAAALAAMAAVVAGYLTPSMRVPRAARPKHAAGDAGHSTDGVLWTVVVVLAGVALAVWIVHNW